MLKLYDGKIGARELVAMFFFSIAMKATDTTPDLLIFTGKNATWIIPIIAAIIILIPLTALLQLLKKYDQGLIEMLFQLGGKAFGYIVGMLLFFVTLFTLANNSRGYADIVSDMYYAKTPLAMIYLFLIIARLGITAISGTSWLTMGVLNVSFVFLILFVLYESNWLQLFPIAGPGIWPLVMGGLSYTSLFSDAIFLAVFFSYVRNYQDYRLASYLGIALSCFWLTMLFITYTIVYNYPALEYINFPFQQTTRLVKIGGLNTHFESIFLGLWVIGSVLHFAIYLYVLTLIFTKTLHIQNDKRLFLPLAALSFLLGLTPQNTVTINHFRIYFLQFTSA